jgi:hypothetical protein
MYRTIARPADRVHATLTSLGLRVADEITVRQAIREQRRLFSVVVRNQAGERFFFKARLQADPWLSRSLRHEAAVLRGLSTHTDLHFAFPHLVADGHDGAFDWIIREFWDADFSGEMNDTYGMTARFLRRVPAARLARAVSDIGQLPKHFRSDAATVRHGRSWYLGDLAHYEKNVFPAFYRSPLNTFGFTPNMFAILRRRMTASKVFGNLVFSHGDLYPNNIFLNHKKQLTINDWDFSNLNLPTFDASMVALHAWRSPTWARQFSRRFSAGRRGLKPNWLATHTSLAVRLTGYAIVRLLNVEAQRYPQPTSRERRELLLLLRSHGTTLKHLLENPDKILSTLAP